jgi:hypothetical protein
MQALDALNKADIIEMKTFTKPPALVHLTMEGVCILLQARRLYLPSACLMGAVNQPYIHPSRLKPLFLSLLRALEWNNLHMCQISTCTQLHTVIGQGPCWRGVYVGRRAARSFGRQLHQAFDRL